MNTSPEITAIEARRLRVVNRYIAGETMREIAKLEEVSPATVCSDVAAVRKQWRVAMNHNLEEWKERELARIDMVESHATESFERSLAETKKSVAERTEADGEVTSKTRMEKQDQAGDPRFLRIMLDCVSERCRILGLYAPKRTDLTSGGQIIKVVGPGVVEAV